MIFHDVEQNSEAWDALRLGKATASNAAWKEDAVTECRDRLSALDDMYFLRGQRALRSLRLWAAGRAVETPLVPDDDETGKSSESR